METSKGKETYIILSIPLIVSIILTCFEVYGKEYIFPIAIIGIGTILILFIILYLVKFLNDREKRWEGNKRVHIELIEKIKLLEQEVKSIKEKEDLKEKINKLENQIHYIRGKNAR